MSGVKHTPVSGVHPDNTAWRAVDTCGGTYAPAEEAPAGAGEVERARAWLNKQGVQTLHAEHPAVLISGLLRHIEALRAQPPAREDALRVAVEALEPFALLAPCEHRSPINMNDPLSRWITIGQLLDASEALAALQAEQKGGA